MDDGCWYIYIYIFIVFRFLFVAKVELVALHIEMIWMVDAKRSPKLGVGMGSKRIEEEMLSFVGIDFASWRLCRMPTKNTQRGLVIWCTQFDFMTFGIR